MEDLKYIEILQLNKKLSGTIHSKKYNIGILSNVTINPLKEIIEYSCRINNINPQIEFGNFDNIVQESNIFKSKDLVIIFYDILGITSKLSDFFEDIEDELYEKLKNQLLSEIDIICENLKKTASVLISSFSSSYYNYSCVYTSKLDRFVNEINTYIKQKNQININLIDIDKIFIQIGIKQSIDFRLFNSSKAPYTLEFLKKYVSSIEPIILRNTGKLKKAVIFDCDNTLWKGIIGEDGITGIDISPNSQQGKYFREVQQIGLYLNKRGVLLGICSKNNIEDVIDVFRNNSDMILKEDNFVIKKINWLDKASNIKSIAKELNIGLDSIVFIDDSDFEINLIKEKLPEVLAIKVPLNISEYPKEILKCTNNYFSLSSNQYDQNKTEIYKQQFQREACKTQFDSINDYLASLKITIRIDKNDKSNIDRISQLTQKTNQFNLTTLRYTESQIEQYMTSSKEAVYSLHVIDKFGDNGLTGVCIVREDNMLIKTIIIDTFLLSCRIIGRNIEFAFLNTIIKDLVNNGYNFIKASFILTQKNEQVAEFYEKSGFKLIQKHDGSKFYSVDILNFEPHVIDYINIVDEFK